MRLFFMNPWLDTDCFKYLFLGWTVYKLIIARLSPLLFRNHDREQSGWKIIFTKRGQLTDYITELAGRDSFTSVWSGVFRKLTECFTFYRTKFNGLVQSVLQVLSFHTGHCNSSFCQIIFPFIKKLSTFSFSSFNIFLNSEKVSFVAFVRRVVWQQGRKFGSPTLISLSVMRA